MVVKATMASETGSPWGTQIPDWGLCSGSKHVMHSRSRLIILVRSGPFVGHSELMVVAEGS